MTVGGLSLKAVCFEVGRALEVAKGIDVPMSLAFSKLSELIFFFPLNFAIFNLSGDRYDTIGMSVNLEIYYDASSCVLCVSVTISAPDYRVILRLTT